MRSVVFFLVCALTTLAQAQTPQTPGSTTLTLTELVVKVGALVSKAEPGKSVPASTPLGGATVILFDENEVTVGVKTTDKDGLTVWAHPGNKKFSVFVAFEGRKFAQFEFQNNGPTVTIGLAPEETKK